MIRLRHWWTKLRARPAWLAGAVVAALVVLGGGLVHYSESPAFCHSCHIMEPYYQAWKHSKHNTVACVECHYPPGSAKTLLWKKFQALSQVAKYVTRTYSSKPFAEIEDSSCLRSGCHSTRLLEGRVTTARGIQFDHRPHLAEPRRGRQLRCVSCHSQIVVGKHVEVTYDTCYLCHFKGRGEGRDLKPLGGCLGCHALPEKSFRVGNMTYNHRDFVTKRNLDCRNCHLGIVRGKGEATQDRCFTCHNQPEKLARIGDIPFIHENHVTNHNVACFHCHREIKHGFTDATSAPSSAVDAPPATPPKPGPAHPPTLTFDCSFCHQDKHGGQLEMYSGRVASLGLPEIPSPMFEAKVDCVGCHYRTKPERDPEFRGTTFKAAEDACVKCHGPAFRGIWQETKSALAAGVEHLDGKLAKAREALTAAPAAGRAGPAAALARAERWHHFVRAGRGEHNVYLAATALRMSNDALDRVGTALNAALPDLNAEPLISGAFCATLCHTKVGVKVPPETVRAFGKTMPHLKHTELLRCVDCHELGGHKRVPLKPDVKATCAGCHPE